MNTNYKLVDLGSVTEETQSTPVGEPDGGIALQLEAAPVV